MKFYTYFPSSASFRLRIALNWKGIVSSSHIHVPVSLAKKEHHQQAYADKNPSRLVPALELDDGIVLTQSLSMIEYLEETHPEPPLLPIDPVNRAYVRALSQIVACDTHPLNNLRVLKHLKKSYGLDQEGINAWYRHWIAEGLSSLEGTLAAPRNQNQKDNKTGKYCFRDQITMADCCLVPQVFNAKRYECDLAPYPEVMRIFSECMQLGPFIAAQPSMQPDAPQ